ncbi:MAG: hypothetical protein ABIG44_03965 [Planctomycetota bacterium]
MSFVIVEPGTFEPVAALAEGEVSLGKRGTLLARVADLELVGIGNYSIILADTSGTLRLALRAVRDGEQDKSVACGVVTRKGGADSGRRRINVARAIKRLSLTPEACAGRYQLNVHHDELLIVNLTGASGKEK